MPRPDRLIQLLSAAAGLALASAALAQIDPSGIDFVTIGDPGNAPWTGGGTNNNRGEVDYSFRIGTFEVTTGQWAEFFNAALDRPSSDRIPNVFAPTQWGAVRTTPINQGGQRFTVPTGNGMLPTGGVDWRTCAIFCNWLCNGKSSDRSAFLNGAYDTSTFGFQGVLFTDQLTHNPGAQYWIPTLDEWMKSASYDPNRYGTGQGGWWQYTNGSDSQYIYAPPPSEGGNGTANGIWSDLQFPGHNPFAVPLGAYSGVTSPWGLYDVAGGTREWIEEYLQEPGEPLPRYRYAMGSAWETGAPLTDHTGNFGAGDYPNFFGYDYGFRVAAAIPGPSSITVLVLSGGLLGLRRVIRGPR